MVYTDFMKREKEYLGFCTQKGYVYSVALAGNEYAVVALKDGETTTLITFQGGNN
jgi:hypothetical protein